MPDPSHGVSAASPPLPFSSVERRIGLYPAADFRITTGRCSDCAVIPQALCYFTDETIAIPHADLPIAGFARGVRASDDVASWAASERFDAPPAYPPLVWIGAPDIVRGARLTDGGKRIAFAGSSLLFEVVPKIPLNRSYYDHTSIAWLGLHTLAIRGTLHDGRCTARTIWPETFRLDQNAPRQPIEPAPEALRALIRGEPRGGAQSPFATVTLWERTPGTAQRREDQAVLALVLNGAQGDDDEAHGGHFAIVTGRVSGDGAIGDWLTNNFYTLDTFSEKGITAAMVPLARRGIVSGKDSSSGAAPSARNTAVPVAS